MPGLTDGASFEYLLSKLKIYFEKIMSNQKPTLQFQLKDAFVNMLMKNLTFLPFIQLAKSIETINEIKGIHPKILNKKTNESKFVVETLEEMTTALKTTEHSPQQAKSAQNLEVTSKPMDEMDIQKMSLAEVLTN